MRISGERRVRERLDERISHADIPLETVLSITRPRLHTRAYQRSKERDMPPISELTAASGNSAPKGAQGIVKERTRSTSIGIVYRGGATGHPPREQHLHQRHRAERHRDQEHRALRSAEPSQLQAESPRAARER